VIENEFGEVGIDDDLLKKNTRMQADEEIIEMMNGCICCTVRQDLVVVLDKLAKRVQAGTLKLDGIVIETTGMADPAPVAQTFFVEPKVAAFARLDGIITLVDAKHIIQHLDEEKPEGADAASSVILSVTRSRRWRRGGAASRRRRRRGRQRAYGSRERAAGVSAMASRRRRRRGRRSGRGDGVDAMP